MPRTAPQMPALLAENAYALFGRRGFDHVTIDDIAARAGVTKGSFYSHYPSKHQIVLAACQHYYRSYQQYVHREIAARSDPLDRLRCLIELSVHRCVVDRHARVFTTEIFARSLKDPQVRASWLQFYDSVRELYIGLVEAIRASGQTTAPHPRTAVDLMLAALEGVKIRAVYEPHIASETEQRVLVEGLLAILLDPGTNIGPTSCQIAEQVDNVPGCP